VAAASVMYLLLALVMGVVERRLRPPAAPRGRSTAPGSAAS
jgi:hypothetical protein